MNMYVRRRSDGIALEVSDNGIFQHPSFQDFNKFYQETLLRIPLEIHLGV